MSKYICQVCGFVYDEAAGLPEAGIAPGTGWEQLPENWRCPLCGAPKSQFRKQETAAQPAPAKKREGVREASPSDAVRRLSSGELAAVCSNLARGCEKQILPEEAALFTRLADYYTARAELPADGSFDRLLEKVEQNLEADFPPAKQSAEDAADRGAKRVLTWSEKVTRIAASVLERYREEGDAALANTKLWVCDICGFLYIGDVPPAVCPVCKVPGFKILEVTKA